MKPEQKQNKKIKKKNYIQNNKLYIHDIYRLWSQ